jgi:hypothetical protein
VKNTALHDLFLKFTVCCVLLPSSQLTGKNREILVITVNMVTICEILGFHGGEDSS